MVSYEEKKQKVIKQYFTQYVDQIYPIMDELNSIIPKHSQVGLGVVQTMFLCTIIDHFGKVMRVGKEHSELPLQPGQNAPNFIFFIDQYFPDAEKCKGEFIYKIFRNGVMHQFVPKAAGAFWSNEPRYMNQLFYERDNIPQINNHVFSNYIKVGLMNIMEKLEGDTLPDYIDGIFEHLIVKNYAFKDFELRDILLNKFNQSGKSLYHPC